MVDFEFSSPTRIVFGNNRSESVGSLLIEYGIKKPLITMGKGGHIKRSGLLDILLSSLVKEGIEYVLYDSIVPNPTLECVKNGRDLYLESNCDFILAVGGGSVIDCSKAIALSISCKNVQELWERCFINYEAVKTDVKVGVILTTAASGSETGESAVITNGNKKLIGSSPAAIPLFAILDPINTLTLPKYQTSCGLADILSHLEERYFVPDTDNSLSDKMLEGAMRNVIQSGEMLMHHLDNVSLRADIMWNATIAHNEILDRGRNGGDWACHMIEHEISARFPVSHGEGIAMITPSWLRFVAKKEECRARLIQFATRVWGADFSMDSELAIEWAILQQESWYKRIGLQTSLKNIEGFSGESIEEISASFFYTPGQFAVLDNDDIRAILEEAFR